MNWNRYYKEQLVLGIAVIIFFIAMMFGWYIQNIFTVGLFAILTVICLYVFAYRMIIPAYDEDKKKESKNPGELE